MIATDMTARTQLIQRSFELAAERCEDLTPLVYRRLFREHPEAEPMFRSEATDLVKGSMLALTIDAILDFAGDRTGNFRMIQCEVQSHDAYGTPRELFGKFFGVIPRPCAKFWGPTGRPRSAKRGSNCWPRSISSSPKAKHRLKRPVLINPARGNSIRCRPSS
jgi:hypothetical protein